MKLFLRSQGVEELVSGETPFLLNSLDRNKTCRTKLSLRSQGVEEFFSEEPPFLLNSLDRNKTCREKLSLKRVKSLI